MQQVLVAILVSLAFAVPAVAQTSSQAPDWRQAVGNLLTGNQDRDNAVQQAYERGYRRGRDDEARQARPYQQPRYDNGRYDRDRDGSYSR